MEKNVKIAFLIQAHNDAYQYHRLVERLYPNAVFTHLDSKTDVSRGWRSSHAVLTEVRHNVTWAGFSQVLATLELIRTALAAKETFSRLVLLSGACYPIKPMGRLLDLFLEDGGRNYIKYVNMRESSHLMNMISKLYFRKSLLLNGLSSRLRVARLADKGLRFALEKSASPLSVRWPFEETPFHGSNWWALNQQTAKFCLDEIVRRKDLARFYSHAFASDEQIFHTLIGNSDKAAESTGLLPFTGRGTYKTANLHLIHPSLNKWYVEEDFDEVASSEKYFVRKVNSQTAGSLLDRIDRSLL